MQTLSKPRESKEPKIEPKKPQADETKFSYLKNREIVREFQTQQIFHTALLYTPKYPLPHPQSRCTEVRCPQEEIRVFYAF